LTVFRTNVACRCRPSFIAVIEVVVGIEPPAGEAVRGSAAQVERCSPSGR
jgi:hypothetical protein